MIRAAHAYVRLGYRVFPCIPNGKRPFSRQGFAVHGLNDATFDLDKIIRWWTQASHANLGLVPSSNVLTLDIDCAEIALTWATQYPELSRAPCTRTPRGGVHYYVRMPQNAPSLKVRAIDERGTMHVRGLNKAYLVAPPSTTPTGSYNWERHLRSPDHLPLLSARLLTRLLPRRKSKQRTPVNHVSQQNARARRYALSALHSEAAQVSSTPTGTRNERLNKAAYALGGYVTTGALDQQEVLDALLHAAYACGHAQDDGETTALNTIRSGLKAGIQAPRPIPNN